MSKNVAQGTYQTLIAKHRWPLLCGVLIFLFVLGLSLSTLTTKPRLWTDEAASIELSKNFATDGVLDFQFAPGKYTGFPYLLQSTGYPTTVPLAVLFTVFGFSFTLARVYMLVWMFLALATVYMVVRKFFDAHVAVLSVLLLATFASYYASGRTVVGEIPGFLFLLLALYWWLEKKSYVVTGFFMGLALVAKPSVFLLVLPAVFFVLTREPRRLIPRLFQVAVGMTPAGLAAVALATDQPFSLDFWRQVAVFYRNPYSSDIFANISHNLAGFLNSTTLIYFSVLFLVVLVARFLVKRKETKWLYDFVGIYSLISFSYYLRSPGWLRYILIAELLILIVLPHAVFTLACYAQKRVKFLRTFQMATVTVYLISALAVLQVVQLFTAADIYTSNQAMMVAHYLDKIYSHARVAVIDNANVYALLTNPKREGVLALTGIPVIGKNPLLNPVLPQVVVSFPEDRFRDEAKDVLAARYRFVENYQGFDIFELKP
ncbi:MAG: hypothetical protein A3C06_02780 [Candidatus Taylorbacteria bacterium RIFCSPHIGHO2_02_FULL_46_13]|uniref:Glycosyltransferase RgtA/B/C/D-like domain-containing protein n=1 Tax=Candidatus Taylorbacteria bacterium RIFCSPHIGHO2_02_FULL_46_13 TaxID=1802312 RepID=A0A1G2MRF6_9BACT|nr:MAG: hypothetical protein A3C06_02780 [Candidatus Taylorbacteria bacterium RIFCSPHIGHO2_02_FULL_46_13]